MTHQSDLPYLHFRGVTKCHTQACTVLETHQGAVQMLHHFCGQLLLSALCAPPNQWLCQGDHGRQTSLQELCHQSWCLHQALSLRQWVICRQCVQAITQEQPPAAFLLWHQHKFPKWDHRECNLQSLQQCVQATTPRLLPMASRHPLCPVTICPQECLPPPQQPASARGWHIKAGAFQLNSSGRQHAHIWVPSVHTSNCTCIRQHSPKTVTTYQTRPQPRTQS